MMKKIDNHSKCLIVVYTILLSGLLLLFFCLAYTARPLFAPKKRMHSGDCTIASIPRAAYSTLIFLKKFHRAPADYHPISVFVARRDELVPTIDEDGKYITYVESHIYPDLEVLPGPERIILGSDGKAYYTPDYYKHITEITRECEGSFRYNAKFFR